MSMNEEERQKAIKATLKEAGEIAKIRKNANVALSSEGSSNAYIANTILTLGECTAQDEVLLKRWESLMKEEERAAVDAKRNMIREKRRARLRNEGYM